MALCGLSWIGRRAGSEMIRLRGGDTVKKPCEICRGSRVSRLPIYRPVSALAFDASAAVSIEQSWRDYPCPECGDQVDMNRVAVLDAHAMIDSRIDDPEFQQHAKRTAAHMLV